EEWRKPLADTEKYLGVPASEYVVFLLQLGTVAFNGKFQKGLTGKIESWLVDMHSKDPNTVNGRGWEGSCGDLSIEKLYAKHRPEARARGSDEEEMAKRRAADEQRRAKRAAVKSAADRAEARAQAKRAAATR